MQRKSNLTRDARVYLLYAENITSSKGYLSLLTVQYTEKTSTEMIESSHLTMDGENLNRDAWVYAMYTENYNLYTEKTEHYRENLNKVIPLV